MELTGLTLGQLSALLAVAATAVTALYMLKLRRRTVVVPFVMLWDRLLADKQASSLFARLRRLLSLLLALLLVSLLALAVADPRHAENSGALRHQVLLIDAGITMQTREGDTTRLEIARKHARRMIEAMGNKDRMLLAQLDRSATPLTPMTNDSALLLAALPQIRATDVSTDLAAGIALASDILRGRSQPEIIMVSDGAGHTGPPLAAADHIAMRHVLVVDTGKARRDVGISAFAVRRFPLDKTRSELLIELLNLSAQNETVELRLDGDGKAIDVQSVSLTAGERKRLIYDNITGVDRALQASLRFADGTHDDLRANDRAYATLPERTRMRVLCVTGGNRYLEAALLLDEYLQVDVVDPAAYVETPTHDVIIFDRNVPATLPSKPAIYLAPTTRIQTLGPLKVTGLFDRPFFDRTTHDHPLLRHLSLRDVNMLSALAVTLDRGDEVIGADARGPLIITGARNAVPFVALTFDVTQSDLPLRVAWPMLLLNALDRFSQQQVGYVDNYRAGERALLTLADAATTATWTAPDGERALLPVTDGHAVIDVAHAGIYTLRRGERDEPIAINAGVVTNIQPRKLTSAVEHPTASSRTPSITREQPWSFLLMAVIAILAVEWFTFHRRWTV